MGSAEDNCGKEASSESAPPEASASGEEGETLRVLDPAAVQFRRQGNQLEIREEGREWREVTLVWLFPLSEQERWVSVVDKEEKEIGVLVDLRELSKESGECAEEELRRRYLVPRITRILACRDRYDLVEWSVETDRGSRRFLTRHLRDKVQEPLPRHLILTDLEGNRYDVPEVEALDPESRRRLEERV